MLSFKTLRAANLARIPKFRNGAGNLSHTKPDGSDWSITQWLQATIGEVGELANIHKKLQRGDFHGKGPEGPTAMAIPLLARELADVMIYLDILMLQVGCSFDTNPGMAGEQSFDDCLKTLERSKVELKALGLTAEEAVVGLAFSIAQLGEIHTANHVYRIVAAPAFANTAFSNCLAVALYLADVWGLNLGDVIASTFNRTSRRIGVYVFIVDDKVSCREHVYVPLAGGAL